MMTRLNVSPVPFRRRLNGAAYRLPKKRSRGVKQSWACGQRSVGHREKTHARTEPRLRKDKPTRSTARFERALRPRKSRGNSACPGSFSKKGNQIVERWTRNILVDRQRNLSKAHPRVRAGLTERNSVAKGARLPSK